ncbi:MAG: class I SAM-dependent methyltransferase [Xanthomonadales bacterium]|nr:class I SAM-dependent methyltransferase [Xanthomonadales bacterium]
MNVTRPEFSSVYQACVREMTERMPSDWSALAKHNAGWRKARFDAESYLVTSEKRYWHALRFMMSNEVHSVLDVGGFLGPFPLALKRLGYDVAIAERYSYYGNAMERIASHLDANGVCVIDADLAEPAGLSTDLNGRFDALTCMAVAEHLAHSPKALLDNLRDALRPGGTLVFEVPNVAYWPKRYAFFFRGETVHSPIEEVYHSAIPFTGHHREYTLRDARYVLNEAGFEIAEEQTFNYTVGPQRPLQFLKYLPAFLFREWAEVIMLGCRKPTAS